MITIKTTGIKKAISEYCNWIKRDWRYRATIMMDKTTGEVWADTFIDCNSWKEYHSDNIMCLSSYIKEKTGDDAMTLDVIRKYALEIMMS